MSKIVIDKEKCIGCGTCAAMCPEIFELEGDKAKVLKPEAQDGCIKDAVEACPVTAISIS